MSTSLIGQMLGKTRITELLARGGMATVYKGYQPDIDRYVAVKVLVPLPEQDQAFVDRFKLEARTIARLQHPHILPLYDFGEQNGLLYLVVAFATGGSLGDQIAKGPIALPKIESTLKQIAGALDYAHRQGIIHRDIKPGNILLDKEDNALLADFGIVKLLGGSTSMTSTSGVVGTPAYMSPEQANGAQLDSRSDVYALGVVAYEMITGRQPFAAETPLQVLLKHLTEPPPFVRDQLRDVPAALDVVIQRALAKDPRDRYQTATEFAQAFSYALSSAETGTLKLPRDTRSNVPTVPAPTLSASTAQPTTIIQAQSNPLLIILVAGAAIAALALAVVALLLVNQPAAPLPPPSVEPTTVASTPPPLAVLPQVEARSGVASFTTTSTLGDTVNLRVENLTPLPPGTDYVAWLVNSQDGTTLRLGTLDIDVQGSGQRTFVDEEGRTLPTLFNQISLSVESEESAEPKGDILYSGGVPYSLTSALQEILVASELGINGASLLDTALAEAQVGATHAGLAAQAANVSGLHLHAEHTINILLGTRDDLDGVGGGSNPGRGIGTGPMLAEIEARINTAAEDASDDRTVQAQIELIRVCLVNSNSWLNEVIQLERELIASSDLAAVEPQRMRSGAAADELINGSDLNGNGTVELFEGECGLSQIGEASILAATLSIRPTGGR